jgi:hypothetical protein
MFKSKPKKQTKTLNPQIHETSFHLHYLCLLHQKKKKNKLSNGKDIKKKQKQQQQQYKIQEEEEEQQDSPKFRCHESERCIQRQQKQQQPF